MFGRQHYQRKSSNIIRLFQSLFLRGRVSCVVLAVLELNSELTSQLTSQLRDPPASVYRMLGLKVFAPCLA